MKIAFQMEALADTVKGENNSLLLIQEANRRGHEVFHYHPDELFVTGEGVFAPVAPVSVDLSGDSQCRPGAYENADLGGMDVILFRQDPPFDMNYYTNTVALDLLKERGVLFVNDPYWIRNKSDKFAALDFKEHIPPTLITRNIAEIEKFFTLHKDVVIKPLYGFHGNGVVRSSSIEDAKVVLGEQVEPLFLQPFIPEIFEGNKRVVFLDGKIEWAIKSVPEKNDFRIYRGSIDAPYELTKEENVLCRKIGAWLKARELVFVGIDLIGPYLMEMNLGSVGSLLRINAVYGVQSEMRVWDVIERKLRSGARRA